MSWTLGLHCKCVNVNEGGWLRWGSHNLQDLQILKTGIALLILHLLFQPLKDGDRISYSLLLDHTQPTQTPRVKKNTPNSIHRTLTAGRSDEAQRYCKV